MEKDIVISVENVSKKFCKDLKKSLFYGLSDIVSQTFRGTSKKELRKEEFWAVKDVSFKLRKGECLGLIGHNGAGKSTLLKMLNGIIAPDEGVIRIQGRTAALIELGAGFNPILTGKENIFNSGVVLGFTRKELEERLDQIIDFSEIREFIDTPVQNYSSGMKVRLGFAVAAHLEPDLLLIDEVLAVGDVGFRIKCYNKIANLLDSAAIILVSHAMPQLAKIGTSILLLDRGHERFLSPDVSKGLEAYYELFEGEEQKTFGEGIDLKTLRINGEDARDKVIHCEHGKPMVFDIEFISSISISKLRLGIQFFDKDLKLVATAFSESFAVCAGESTSFKLGLDRSEFSRGKFSIGLVFAEGGSKDNLSKLIKRYIGVSTIMAVGIDALTPATFQLIGKWTQSELGSH